MENLNKTVCSSPTSSGRLLNVCKGLIACVQNALIDITSPLVEAWTTRLRFVVG